MRSLVDNLLCSADRYPQRCAIKDGARDVSYQDLVNDAASIAAQLRSEGISKGDRVAVILPNNSEFVAAYYGVLMAGGIVVSLNAAAKARELAAWLRDCDAAFVYADESNAEVRASLAALEHPPKLLNAAAASRAELLVHRGQEDDPACILYTSGTTGQPKGVVLSHKNILSNTSAIVEYLRLTCDDSIVTVLPFYYSYGSSVLHTHLKVGGRLILQKNFVYPHAVIETLSAERATGFAGVPSTFALLLSRVKLQDYDLSAVRYVTQAGGAMAPALTQRLREAFPLAEIFVMYGQTEATARLTYLPPHALDAKLGSVGIPVPGVKIEVRTEHGTPAPVGQVGDIWASGPNIMLGYWRNEAATAEVLRDGWLKTGDMGRMDEDGYLYIVGRRSDMIKTGAHRVHPQDIEDVIAELVEVQEVAVVGEDDEMLGQTIKAFVVPAAGAQISPMRVQAYCRERLAAYKVPKTVVIVSSLPRTSSGKIRRAELQERAT